MSGLKPYPEYKDSEVDWLGKVPVDWRVCGVKFVAKTVAGSGFPHEYQGVEGEKYPFLKVNALGRADAFGVISSREDSISEDVAKKLRASVIPAGSVVLAKIGAALLLGRIRTLSEDSCIDNNLLSVQVSNKAVSRFVFYAMQQIQFDVLVNPGAVPSLSERNFRSFKLAFPPFSEQCAIAAFLDHETVEIDAFIRDQEELIELLKERRAATISQAVTKGLDLTVQMKDSGFDWLGKVPEHWKVSRLKRLGAIRYGIGEPPGYVSEGVPLIRATNVSEGRVTPEKMVFVNPTDIPAARILWLREGDIIVVRSGALTGDSAIIRREYAGAIAGFDMVFRANPSVNADFIQYGLLSSYVKSAQLDIARMRAAQPHLNAEELGNSYFAHPTTRAEYEQIVSYLNYETAEIDAAIADAKEAIDLSKERRSALISAVVTGKIDVRNHITAELGAA